jgi:trans-aconitate methyltransferase
MGVAAHLGIRLAEYDERIRTFIPDYEEMLDVAAAAVPARARTLVDLGIGTGALSARCLKTAPRARVVGIDVDPEILTLAARRLRDRAVLAAGTFLRTPLPPCDAVVASFALHHVRTRAAKAVLYRRIRAALRPRGLFVSVDCQPASDPASRRMQRDAWLAHLRRSYSATQSAGLLTAWSREDVYVPLDSEVALMRRCGFRVEVLWRRGSFAVLMGRL